jgi:hypothetical protein
MARATFIAKASASNFVSDFVPDLGVSVVAVLMKATVAIHSVFVTAKLAGFALNTRGRCAALRQGFLLLSQSQCTSPRVGLGRFLARTICGQQWFELGQVVGLSSHSLAWDE